AENVNSAQTVDAFVKLKMSELPQPGKYKLLAQQVAGKEDESVVNNSKAETVLNVTEGNQNENGDSGGNNGNEDGNNSENNNNNGDNSGDNVGDQNEDSSLISNANLKLGYQKDTDTLILQYQIEYSKRSHDLSNHHYLFAIPNEGASHVKKAHYVDSNRYVQEVEIQDGKIKVDAKNVNAAQTVDVFVKLEMSELPQPGKYKLLAQQVA